MPGIIRGKDNMASETAVQSFSITRSKESSVILTNILHIASNIIYREKILEISHSTVELTGTKNRFK